MDQQGFSQMDNYAHQNGIGVIYPEGVKRSWNVSKAILNDENDIGFVNALIDSVSLKYNIDSNRIYALLLSQMVAPSLTSLFVAYLIK